MTTQVSLVEELEKSWMELRMAVHNRPLEELRFKPAPDKWSAQEVVCHILDCERLIFSQRLRRILAEENPLLPDIDHLPWVAEHQYQEQDFFAVMEQLRLEREAFIQLVATVPGDKLFRKGTHQVRGPVDGTGIITYCATHTRVHIKQIERTLAEAAARR